VRVSQLLSQQAAHRPAARGNAFVTNAAAATKPTLRATIARVSRSSIFLIPRYEWLTLMRVRSDIESSAAPRAAKPVQSVVQTFVVLSESSASVLVVKAEFPTTVVVVVVGFSDTTEQCLVFASWTTQYWSASAGPETDARTIPQISSFFISVLLRVFSPAS
jgi:hypothetical protein